MKLLFAPVAWNDFLHFQQHDWGLLDRVNKLIRDVQRDPYSCRGKPVPLKHALAVIWCRRINDEHRMVFRVSDGMLEIARVGYQY